MGCQAYMLLLHLRMSKLPLSLANVLSIIKFIANERIINCLFFLCNNNRGTPCNSWMNLSHHLDRFICFLTSRR